LEECIEEEIKPIIKSQVQGFLKPSVSSLGILELKEIANTRASLRVTELFLSELFEFAKQNRRSRNIFVVLEEAHTVIPEFNLFKSDKADTEAVVGRLAQIALQGRKFGVGLLIISQRTALVSKSLLSQCNTYFTFSLVDKTSLEYLGNVYSQEQVEYIPNLLELQMIAYGKGILSQRPVIVEIPFSKDKKAASESLKVKLNDEGSKLVSNDQNPPAEPSQESSNNEEDVPF
ncbi:MAG: hypothetical protein ABH878_02020, partial [bacterium]